MQTTKRAAKPKTQNGWIGWVFLAVIWLLIISSFRDFLQTKKGFSRIKEAEERLTRVQGENEELAKKLELVSSSDYKERLVREKLNMQKSDEIVVVLPRVNTDTMSFVDSDDKGVKENWKKWLEALGL